MNWKNAAKFLAVVALVGGYVLTSSGCDDLSTNGFGTIDPAKDAAEFEEKQNAANESTDGQTDGKEAASSTDDKVVMKDPQGGNNTDVAIKIEDGQQIQQADAAIKIGDGQEDAPVNDQAQTSDHEHEWKAETVFVNVFQSETKTHWECDFCVFSTSVEAELEPHSLTHVYYTASTATIPLTELWVIKCDYCDYSSENQTDVVQHQQEYSGEPAHIVNLVALENVPPYDLTYYTCSCGQFESSSAQAAEQHRKDTDTGHPGYDRIEETAYETYVFSC